MKKKEHFEVILEDMNSKFDLVFENFQSLGHKINKYNRDFNKQIDEMNEFLRRIVNI